MQLNGKWQHVKDQVEKNIWPRNFRTERNKKQDLHLMTQPAGGSISSFRQLNSIVSRSEAFIHSFNYKKARALVLPKLDIRRDDGHQGHHVVFLILSFSLPQVRRKRLKRERLTATHENKTRNILTWETWCCMCVLLK